MNKDISMPVSIYALGGLGEVGKNMYCIENEETIVIIDCGVRFPGLEFPGIDYIVPGFTHLKNNRSKVKALFITHGHEDHIGGIPFLLQSINVPVIYAPRLATALINAKLEETKIKDRTKIIESDEKTVVKVDKFTLSFFRVTHSIPDSFGIVIDTPEGRIVTTGDFKVDLTPIGPDFELNRLARLGDEGVDLLLSDSTNAENEGYTPSERNVYDSIYEIFENTSGRLIISTFSSNISRIQQVCECALKFNRKIVIVGRSMEKVVDISRSFGYIKIPDSTFIKPDDIKNFRPNEILILCTGSQGEPNAALSRIAGGEHRDVRINNGDTVVFSSSAIPGNGIMIDNLVNQLTRCGAEVVTNSILSDIHSSGHPGKQELRIIMKLLKPKYLMPMHGEYRMLKLHAELATTLGIPMENCFVLDNGDSVVMSRHKIKRGYPVEHSNTYIDGKDINGLADSVMDDRKILTDDGMIAVTLSIDTQKNKIIGPIEVLSCGFIGDNGQILNNIKKNLEKVLPTNLGTKFNYGEVKNTIKTLASESVYRETNRHPMIIPLIMSKN